MGNIKPKDKVTFEKLLGMNTGFVADFSDASFKDFIINSIGIDVYDANYSYKEHPSKAKKLRHLWDIETDAMIGKLMSEMCDEIEVQQLRKGEYSKVDISFLSDARIIADKLKDVDIGIELPSMQNETLSTLMEHIKEQLAKDKPEFAIDRQHTFATKMLRQICENKGIVVTNPKGENLPLQSLIGMLSKEYAKLNKVISEFSIKAIRNNISLFDEYNSIRNNKSYAHDNEIMNKAEAEYVVRTVAAAIKFIDQLEKSINKASDNKLTNDDLAFRLS